MVLPSRDQSGSARLTIRLLRVHRSIDATLAGQARAGVDWHGSEVVVDGQEGGKPLERLAVDAETAQIMPLHSAGRLLPGAGTKGPGSKGDPASSGDRAIPCATRVPDQPLHLALSETLGAGGDVVGVKVIGDLGRTCTNASSLNTRPKREDLGQWWAKFEAASRTAEPIVRCSSRLRHRRSAAARADRSGTTRSRGSSSAGYRFGSGGGGRLRQAAAARVMPAQASRIRRCWNRDLPGASRGLHQSSREGGL